MARTGTAFVLGAVIGAMGALLVLRILDEGRSDDPEDLMDELAEQFASLEAKLKAGR